MGVVWVPVTMVTGGQIATALFVVVHGVMLREDFQGRKSDAKCKR